MFRYLQKEEIAMQSFERQEGVCLVLGITKVHVTISE